MQILLAQNRDIKYNIKGLKLLLVYVYQTPFEKIVFKSLLSFLQFEVSDYGLMKAPKEK